MDSEIYKSFFNNSLDMLCIAGTDGYFKELNPSWQKTLGYSLEELKSKPFVEFVHPDDIENTINEAQKLNTGDYETVSFTNRYRCKDGQYKWLLWNSAASKDGYLLAAARDITELKEKENLLEEMGRIGKIGSWTVDVDTMQSTWSEQTYAIHDVDPGTPTDVVQGISFYSPEAQAQITKCVMDGIEKGTSWDVELPFVSATKTKKWVRAIGHPVYNEEKVVELRGIFQDISTRKFAEINLENEKINSFQASRLASLGEMAGSIAHEINNPLEIISLASTNITTLLESKNADMDLIYENCEKIFSTVDRIASIINGLQKLSRDSSSAPKVNTKLNSVISDVLSLCQQRFQSAGFDINVENKLSANESVNCRPVEISQILINLLNNAFDAIREEQNKWVKIVIDKSSTDLVIKVLDSGQGIDDDKTDKIMNPFFTTKPIGEGTGLGLSISHSIARNHGGSLKYSKENGNTCFTLQIPNY